MNQLILFYLEVTLLIYILGHEFPGPHRIPVVFKLSNGIAHAMKDVMIYFSGYSVPPEKQCLHFRSKQQYFKPVSIGSVDAPLQTYMLMNPGLVDLEYNVDTQPLIKVNLYLSVDEGHELRNGNIQHSKNQRPY